MPSWDLFEHQSDEYKTKVLPPDVKARVAVEQAVHIRLVAICRPNGHIIGMRTLRRLRADQGFAEEFGFTTENVVAAARKALGK